MRAITALFILPLLNLVSAPQSATAQTRSGNIGLNSQYVDRDLFVYNNKPTVQASLNLSFSNECSVDAWIYHGLSTKDGSELDVGVSCSFNVGEGTEIEMYLYRDLLYGTADITEGSVKVIHGNFDISITEYLWDNNPDATRFEAGYTVKPTDKLSARFGVVHEFGFGEPAITIGALDLVYKISKHWSLSGTVLAPIQKAESDERGTRAFIGLSYIF